jgi:hypothetical protein
MDVLRRLNGNDGNGATNTESAVCCEFGLSSAWTTLC